mmetsp:Transcript_3698/g.10717  ORF Transcript_3698/g.10717 Transcript_3698/m.10717 type:complete len:215 (+) Transcript_3698:1451-2095(+)
MSIRAAAALSHRTSASAYAPSACASMMETRATLAVDRRVSRSATEARAARRVDAAPMAIPAAASACRCASPSLASFTARYAASISACTWVTCCKPSTKRFQFLNTFAASFSLTCSSTQDWRSTRVSSRSALKWGGSRPISAATGSKSSWKYAGASSANAASWSFSRSTMFLGDSESIRSLTASWRCALRCDWSGASSRLPRRSRASITSHCWLL